MSVLVSLACLGARSQAPTACKHPQPQELDADWGGGARLSWMSGDP